MAGRKQQGLANAGAAAQGLSRPIKIVHIIFRLDVGGLENGLVNVINGLPGGQFRHTVICLDTFTDFRNRLKAREVEVVALNKRPGLDPMMYGRLWKLLRRIRPDIVHTRNLGTLPCVFVAVAAGVRVRIHGEHGWDMVDIGGNQFKYRMLRRIVSPLVTVYVAVSRHIADWLTGHVGIGEAKVVHIINGVDASRFISRDDARADAQVPADMAATVRPEGRLVIGTVGRLEEVKDQRTLVEAIALLVARRAELAARLEVVIVGDGSLESVLKRTVMDAGIGKIVRLVGRQDDIPGYLRGMDVFVLPSLNEGISNTILEAMACGVPVIATAVGGNPEIVDDGKTGLLVPVSDPEALAGAIERYHDSPDLRRAHGVAARQRVLDTLSLEKMIANYRELYLNAAGRQ